MPATDALQLATEFQKQITRGSLTGRYVALEAKLHRKTIDFTKYCSECGKGCPDTSDCESIPSPLPHIPIIVEPQPVSCGIFEMNDPSPDSPVVVTCNYLHTHTLLGEVLLRSKISCFLLSVDTGGDPLEMAVVKGKFRVDDVDTAIKESDLEAKINHRVLIVPGLSNIETIGRWKVVKGPISALELPLFLRFFMPK